MGQATSRSATRVTIRHHIDAGRDDGLDTGRVDGWGFGTLMVVMIFGDSCRACEDV